MDYKKLIDAMRGDSIELIVARAHDSADALETMMAERDAAVRDLTEVCKENPDACQFCKHMPCTEPYGRCIGWEWKGLNASGGVSK